MGQHYDVIVIGGGHNGLVNAAYLAKAGKKVLVLERRHILGGAAVTEEIIPGFLFSECSYVVSLLRPEIIRELDLPRHGLEILPLDGTFTPVADGPYLWRVNDHERARRKFAGIATRFRALSDGNRRIQIQLMTMSAADFLDQWFETDVLKATLSASGIIGTFLGVRSPGTAYVLLHHYMGAIDGSFRSWGLSVGGTGAISNAIAQAAREAGAEIRTEAPVAGIRIKHGRAIGVTLATGDELDADVVLSSVDPRLTFLQFVGAREVPSAVVDDVRG